MGVYSGKVNGGKLDGRQAVTGGSLNPRGQLVGGAIQTPEHFGVSSWNGETGDVTYTAPVTSVNGQTGDVIVTGGVTSVNGEVGDVVLDASDVGALPDDTTYVSSFNGQSGAVTFSETDPTVPAWAKTPNKPTYTASEVGALPASTQFVSTFNGHSGAVTFTETDPTVPSWAKQPTKPTYTAQEVGALPSNTQFVSSFNGSTGAITYTAPVTSVNGQTGDVTVGLTPLIGTTAQVTPTQVATAVGEGRTVAITHTIPFFGDATFANFGASQTLNMVVSTTMVYQRNSFNVFQLIGILSSNAWSIQMGVPIVDFTPTGTVSRPTITCTPTTASVNSITGVGTLPTLTDDVTNETLSFSWAQGTLPTQGTAQTVMTGVSAISSEPTFSGNNISKAVELFLD